MIPLLVDSTLVKQTTVIKSLSQEQPIPPVQPSPSRFPHPPQPGSYFRPKSSGVDRVLVQLVATGLFPTRYRKRKGSCGALFSHRHAHQHEGNSHSKGRGAHLLHKDWCQLGLFLDVLFLGQKIILLAFFHQQMCED